VRFRHLNSGKLLAVKSIVEEPENEKAGGSSKRGAAISSRSKHQHHKFVLTLGTVYSADEINKRVAQINEIEEKNRFKSSFNPKTSPEINGLNHSVHLDQIFEIENSIIENCQNVKDQCVVKIKNMMYNNFLSVEVALEEGEEEDGGGEEASKSGAGAGEGSHNRSMGEIDDLVD